MTERSSGFLVPNVGYSNSRGAELGLAYFQTLGRSYDTTIHTDLFTKSFLGIFGDVLGWVVEILGDVCGKVEDFVKVLSKFKPYAPSWLQPTNILTPRFVKFGGVFEF